MTDTKDELERALDVSDEKLRLTSKSMLGALTDREKEVLEMRFGLTEEDVEHERVTREKIFAIEKRALEKLKARSRSTRTFDLAPDDE